VVATRFGDTAAVSIAHSVLELVAEKRGEQEEAAEAAARAKMEKEERQEAEQLDKALGPARAARDLGQKLNSKGLQESNQTRARKNFEQAASSFVKALDHLEKIKKDFDEDTYARYEAVLRDDAVRAYLNAGNIHLARGSFSEAEKLGRKALAVDPENSSAQSFMNSIQAAQAMNNTFDARYRRQHRR
jgi:tetratricopeptide (TPR) repeat protein